jgi:hypothetical protein
LNLVQEIGIRFYAGQINFHTIEQHAQTHHDAVFKDINDRMPRQEAKAIFDLIKPIGDVV